MSLLQSVSISYSERPHEVSRRLSAIRELPARCLSVALAATRFLWRSLQPGPRLTPGDLRDIGLLPEQSPNAPLWGDGGIMWRP